MALDLVVTPQKQRELVPLKTPDKVVACCQRDAKKQCNQCRFQAWCARIAVTHTHTHTHTHIHTHPHMQLMHAAGTRSSS